MKTSGRRIAKRGIGLLLAILICAGIFWTFGAEALATESWEDYSSLETIVLEDEYANLTEEDIGVLPVGQYRISIPGVGNLTYGEEFGPLSISQTEESLFTVIYQVNEDLQSYTLSPNDDVYSFVGIPGTSYSLFTKEPVATASRTVLTSVNSDNGYYRSTQDSPCSIRWYFEENGDGTCKMVMYDMTDPHSSAAWKYYAYYDALAGQIVLKRDTKNLSTNFKIEMVSRGTEQFNQYISYGGKITLRLPKAAKTTAGLTDRRAAKWANDAEKAYRYFLDLTNFVPYENIIVKAYANCDYMAYVTSGYNVITVSYSAEANEFGPQKLWYIEDIGELVQRGEAANDWNFCIMHEMGHMFDRGRGWNFETECLTDFKLSYCLYRGGASAIPSELSVNDVFTYDNIEVCYRRMGGNFSKTYKYDFYGAAFKLVMMQKKIGWAPVYRAFHWYSENEALPDGQRTVIPSNNYGKFQLFIDKISEYAGIDVQHECFSETDWAVFMNKYGNPDYPNPPQPVPPEDGAEVIKVNALFGKIENYANHTFFITGIESASNDTYFTKLKNGVYTLKVKLTDETEGLEYQIDRYHFNDQGNEFYSTTFLRLNLCNYGIEPKKGHDYTMKLDIYSGETRVATGESDDGAFSSSQSEFNNSGAIMPASIPYACTVNCRVHHYEIPVWSFGGDCATLSLKCRNCEATEEHEAEVTYAGGRVTAQTSVGGVNYSTGKSYEVGDVSGNGYVNIADVTMLLNFLALDATMQEEQLSAGTSYRLWTVDVDENGRFDISDVTKILNIISDK